MRVHTVACVLLFACLSCCLHSADAGKLSDDMLAVVNKARKDAGVAPMQFSQELEDVAQERADEMAAGGETISSRLFAWTSRLRSQLKLAGQAKRRSTTIKPHIQPLAASSLSECPVKIVLAQGIPDWDRWTLEEFLQALMDEPVLKKMILSPSITHMAMAKAGSGQDTYIALALGQCTGSLKVSSS